MTRYFDLRETVLIVVGHGILAEEEDRPPAYDLKRLVNARANGAASRRGVVVTDVWLIGQELGDFFPAIAVGGPDANAFTEQIYGDLPLLAERDQESFVQMAEGGKRAAVWGTSPRATREAVDTFVREGLLERFLELAWRG